MKKINSKIFKLISATFFISSCFLLNNSAFAKTNDHPNDPYPPRLPKVWHVVWVSSTTGPLTALWTKMLNENDGAPPWDDHSYYGVWSNELRATLMINIGIGGFNGDAYMNNGDYCQIRGLVYNISNSQDKVFDGHFNCAKGDKGTITGTFSDR